MEQGKQATTLLLVSKASKVVSEIVITILETGGSLRVPSRLGKVSWVPTTRFVTLGLSSFRKDGVECVFSASISHGSLKSRVGSLLIATKPLGLGIT